jgi:hypothetical protein
VLAIAAGPQRGTNLSPVHENDTWTLAGRILCWYELEAAPSVAVQCTCTYAKRVSERVRVGQGVVTRSPWFWGALQLPTAPSSPPFATFARMSLSCKAVPRPRWGRMPLLVLAVTADVAPGSRLAASVSSRRPEQVVTLQASTSRRKSETRGATESSSQRPNRGRVGVDGKRRHGVVKFQGARCRVQVASRKWCGERSRTPGYSTGNKAGRQASHRPANLPQSRPSLEASPSSRKASCCAFPGPSLRRFGERELDDDPIREIYNVKSNSSFVLLRPPHTTHSSSHESEMPEAHQVPSTPQT